MRGLRDSTGLRFHRLRGNDFQHQKIVLKTL